MQPRRFYPAATLDRTLEELINLPEPALNSNSAPTIDTATVVLQRMGVPQLAFAGTPLLNSYLSLLLRQARLAAAEQWPQVLAAAALSHYAEQLLPENGERSAGAETVGALADGFSKVFGADSQKQLQKIGLKTTKGWLETTQQRPFRMMSKPATRVADVLMLFTSSMDRVRGEPLHVWKPIDEQQFWIIHYANLGVFGRSIQVSSCAFWLGAYQALLELCV